MKTEKCLPFGERRKLAFFKHFKQINTKSYLQLTCRRKIRMRISSSSLHTAVVFLLSLTARSAFLHYVVSGLKSWNSYFRIKCGTWAIFKWVLASHRKNWYELKITHPHSSKRTVFFFLGNSFKAWTYGWRKTDRVMLDKQQKPYILYFAHCVWHSRSRKPHAFIYAQNSCFAYYMSLVWWHQQKSHSFTNA